MAADPIASWSTAAPTRRSSACASRATCNCPSARRQSCTATTDSARVDRVLVDELKLGQSIIRNLEIPALSEQDLGGEGMIGIDALVEQRLMLDFEKRVIKAEDARQPAQLMDGVIVVTARRRRGQLILTQVTAAGLPVEAVIDTGTEITIGNLALRDKLIRGNRKKFDDHQGDRRHRGDRRLAAGAGR